MARDFGELISPSEDFEYVRRWPRAGERAAQQVFVGTSALQWPRREHDQTWEQWQDHCATWARREVPHLFDPPAEQPSRTVYLRGATGGGPLMVIDREGSTAPTHAEISEVPADTPTDEVILAVSYLVFSPWPKQAIPWPRIKDLPQGAIFRG